MRRRAMYKVIEAFTDRLTNEVYYPGDLYPRNGEPDADRVKELSTKANAHGRPLIEADEPVKKPVKKATKKTTKKAE